MIDLPETPPTPGDLVLRAEELEHVSLDNVAMVTAYVDAGRAAIERAGSLEEARGVLGMAKVLKEAVRVRDLGREASIAASALTVRAERRVGQLIVTERSGGRLAIQGGTGANQNSKAQTSPTPRSAAPSTLADHGISHDQAAEYARLAAPNDEVFEQAIERVAEKLKPDEGGQNNVTRTAVLRLLDPEAEQSPSARWIDADKFVTACQRVAQTGEPAIAALRFGVYPGDDLPQLLRRGLERSLEAAADAIRRAQQEMRR